MHHQRFKKRNKTNLCFSRRFAAEISHVNLTTFSIHHDRNRESFLLVKPPNATDNIAVPVPSAVAHVEPRHVHASFCERFELLEPARGGPDGADQLRPPRASESVLFKLGFRHCIDVYPGGSLL